MLKKGYTRMKRRINEGVALRKNGDECPDLTMGSTKRNEERLWGRCFRPRGNPLFRRDRMNHRCKICGGETCAFTQEKFQVTYHQCVVCEFIFRDPLEILSKEEEYTIYEGHENALEDKGYVAYLNRFIQGAVLPFVGPSKEGLDYGSGPSPVLAKILQRDHGYTMDLYDLFYAPEKVFLSKRYDLITSVEVVEHFTDPMREFRWMKEALKTGGVLAIQTQLHPKDWALFKNWYYMRDPSHVAFYTTDTFVKLGEMLGLRLIYTDEVRYVVFRKEGPPVSVD